MNSYVIGAARHENGKLVEVAIQCIDEPQGPYQNECEDAFVDDVIERIRRGDKVVTLWSLPGWGGGTIPVEIVTLSSGEESIEVVEQGQPDWYRMVNLPRLGRTVA
ncbi:hypothetical protein [Polaromonas sp. C04]|uniref:hypothetical protein n=1 Tax=Polaromonas sp. C04 TaxID=1945857 RepID=UPI000984854A|nr:hypothetical protein [Polaromonas sp. C04]OOG58034.1 hypothetical protein B0E49_04170 [Polaromonas sp. C04]